MNCFCMVALVKLLKTYFPLFLPPTAERDNLYFNILVSTAVCLCISVFVLTYVPIFITVCNCH